MFSMVIIKLDSNGILFTNENGKISVIIHRNEDYFRLLFRVTDSGYQMKSFRFFFTGKQSFCKGHKWRKRNRSWINSI